LRARGARCTCFYSATLDAIKFIVGCARVLALLNTVCSSGVLYRGHSFLAARKARPPSGVYICRDNVSGPLNFQVAPICRGGLVLLLPLPCEWRPAGDSHRRGNSIIIIYHGAARHESLHSCRTREVISSRWLALVFISVFRVARSRRRHLCVHAPMGWLHHLAADKCVRCVAALFNAAPLVDSVCTFNYTTPTVRYLIFAFGADKVRFLLVLVCRNLNGRTTCV
jgi:hypothetical protein